MTVREKNITENLPYVKHCSKKHGLHCKERAIMLILLPQNSEVVKILSYVREGSMSQIQVLWDLKVVV